MSMLGHSFFRGSYQIEQAHLLVAALVVMLPVALLFCVTQKVFSEGITLLGVRS